MFRRKSAWSARRPSLPPGLTWSGRRLQCPVAASERTWADSFPFRTYPDRRREHRAVCAPEQRGPSARLLIAPLEPSAPRRARRGKEAPMPVSIADTDQRCSRRRTGACRASLAGPPLLCHPFDIGDARSLPWDGTRAFWQGRADYRLENLAADTEALGLMPSTPVIVNTLNPPACRAVRKRRRRDRGRLLHHVQRAAAGLAEERPGVRPGEVRLARHAFDEPEDQGLAIGERATTEWPRGRRTPRPGDGRLPRPHRPPSARRTAAGGNRRRGCGRSPRATRRTRRARAAWTGAGTPRGTPPARGRPLRRTAPWRAGPRGPSARTARRAARTHSRSPACAASTSARSSSIPGLSGSTTRASSIRSPASTIPPMAPHDPSASRRAGPGRRAARGRSPPGGETDGGGGVLSVYLAWAGRQAAAHQRNSGAWACSWRQAAPRRARR